MTDYCICGYEVRIYQTPINKIDNSWTVECPRCGKISFDDLTIQQFRVCDYPELDYPDPPKHDFSISDKDIDDLFEEEARKNP